MNSKYQKYVNALFAAAGALVWFLTQHYTEVAIGYFQLGRKFGGGVTDTLQVALPLILGILTFVVLRANRQALEFTTDATSEMAKVNWPDARDTRIGTIVVIITVLVAGITLGLIDMAFVSIIRTLLGA